MQVRRFSTQAEDGKQDRDQKNYLGRQDKKKFVVNTFKRTLEFKQQRLDNV